MQIYWSETNLEVGEESTPIKKVVIKQNKVNWINLTQCRSVLVIDFAIDDVEVESSENVAMNVTVASTPVPPVEMAPLRSSPAPADIATGVPSTPSKFGANVIGLDKEEGRLNNAYNKVVPDNQVKAPDPIETEDPLTNISPPEPLSLVERLRRNLPEEVPHCPCLYIRKLVNSIRQKLQK